MENGLRYQQHKIKPSKDNKFFIGDSAKVKTQHFKSTKSKKTQSIDHFIQMKDGIIGSVSSFIQFENKIYLVLQSYDVIEKCYHLRKIKSNQSVHVYSINDIAYKLLYIQFADTQAIVKEPNSFEN